MRRRANSVLGVVFGVLMIGSAVARAQDSPGAVIYRLNQGSTYQQGCFPPCLCPVSQPAAVQGTLILTPLPTVANSYPVSEVNWVFSFGNHQQFVTGSGTYEVTGTQQRLHLDLQINGQAVQHFDSGLVARQKPFPNIKVTISLHGERCFDTVFVVDTSPVPTAKMEIQPYHLVAGSTFQQGCFPPCQCALRPKQTLGGTFTLVNLAPDPLFNHFAVVDADWSVASPTAVVPTLVQGNGFYKVGGEVAVQQEMSLEMTVNNGPVTHFDSGLVQGGGTFPKIEVTVSIHGGRCADTVMVIKASP